MEAALPEDLLWEVRRRMPWRCAAWDAVSWSFARLTRRHHLESVHARLASQSPEQRACAGVMAVAAATAWFWRPHTYRDDSAAACVDQYACDPDEMVAYARAIALDAPAVERHLDLPGTAERCLQHTDEIVAMARHEWKRRDGWRASFPRTAALYHRHYCGEDEPSRAMAGLLPSCVDEDLVRDMAESARRAVVPRYRDKCRAESESAAVEEALCRFIDRGPYGVASAPALRRLFQRSLPRPLQPRAAWVRLGAGQQGRLTTAARAWRIDAMRRARDWTPSALSRLSKTELVAFAVQLGIEPTGTTGDLVVRIMAER